MLVFVDESGDAGLKLSQGSSRYFTVTLVAFEDDDEACAADTRISLLKRELGLSERFEFKFNKADQRLRRRFLEALAPYNFFYFGIVINKANLTGQGFQYKDSFYKYVCGLVFENAKPYLNLAHVVVDGSGSKDFRKQLATYLRKRINDKGSPARYISWVKVQDSRSNNLLQLADMLSGAVHRSFDVTKQDSTLYRALVAHREIFVQFWPKRKRPTP